MGELWTQIGSTTATFLFVWAVIRKCFPHQVWENISRYAEKLTSIIYPYITITFPEHSGERLRKNEAFTAIQNYLGSRSSIRAKRFRAEAVKNSKSLVLSMDEDEEVVDEYEGVKMWWTCCTAPINTLRLSYYPSSDEKRFYRLTFHRSHRHIVLGAFVNHIMDEGKAVSVKNRQRKLYMNNSGGDWWHNSSWRHIPFEHPGNFQTLAMNPDKKTEIINDLIKFRNGKHYYKKVGKAWKRGYLLYGPPGTGKSTMIAAIANFMEYDVYDLELTSVKDNAELKKLLIEISSKSIIDIDCSLDLTGRRKKGKTEEEEEEEETEEKRDLVKKVKEEEEEDKKKESKVTLSGLLNFIDGIWSSCGGERLIVFTTNHREKLDEALIRRGRMDKHIEMGYCCFETFKVLAMNYLDVENHELFDGIRPLLEKVEITPADVAENLMPKYEGEETEDCFKRLIQALQNAKESAAAKNKKKQEEEEEEEVGK